jgi:hypothetical protein
MLVASASAVGLHYSLPPALGERRHRGLARRLVAVRRRAVLVVTERSLDGPHRGL